MHPTTEDFSRFVSEVSGPSRDLPIRAALSERAISLVKEFDQGETALMTDWFADNITLIIGLDEAGKIFKGKKEVMKCYNRDEFEAFYPGDFESVPILVVVDRGRITCHMKRFISDHNFGNVKEETFLVILDLNKQNCIERVEYRLLERKEVDGKAGRDQVKALVEEAKERAVNVNHTKCF